MVNSRRKGARGEREWRDVLRENGWPEARRGQQYSGNPDAPDVVGGPAGWHAEVKVREAHNAWAWMEQAEHDSGGRAVPYVAMKRNGKQWLVVLRASDFLNLVKPVNEAAKEMMREAMMRCDAVVSGSRCFAKLPCAEHSCGKGDTWKCTASKPCQLHGEA